MYSDLILHTDQKHRCAWAGQDPLYVHYHDTDWGVPEFDSRALFEKLILDGFQAGLSWITILKRREGFREAFQGFDPAHIATWGTPDIETLMQDTRIIRNRAKIAGTIQSARAFLDIEATQGFSHFLWDFVDGTPLQPHFQALSDVPTQTDISQAMSKALKQKGFSFCGPVITYAFMQAVGMTNDHLTQCCRFEACCG